ncbi:MupA/Atu3671 family FMN-dependent luciferase-like monooxygenase [Legionella longbeachae]|uniref:Putative luciferase-like monooxygenase n=1 Tax=Legionella longbeachae serogroup 1 (strain NSW150) TaxID=661367 RepID=D3HR06_LEGLN|nr:MupA/Atu3671 family FMN-dependent luciferase-like monooxygenase [Legionella longbeachae]VEE01841.1 luciferase-like monooxygenase [Legionella oakridgensis]HBD7399350.1 LLM class flavin-dependent oxidoreductase [Legionella pneumophila]ARB91841.1 LLM class flavin-dependent oxidoreductase [Legionella longbeachae]ARM35015.1 LLM class flavin-dependent oxidoreductase [Legionella longbeachae]EEZ95569.1 luciferase-like monooxygenase [Legionella longbeachae D-4968]
MYDTPFFEDWLITHIADELEVNPDEILIDVPLAQLGLDSQTAITISGNLEILLETRLEPTLLFEYPTIQDLARYLATIKPITPGKKQALDFTLFFFALQDPVEGKYELIKKAVQFADQHGFKAVWIPERHFNAMGGNFPNPSVISAALATMTKQLSLRAGSVVLPLHDPLRVVEEWSVVDQLSQGRVELSFASGWHVDDFVLAPENYEQRKEYLLSQIPIVRQLWKGDAITRVNGHGNSIQVRSFPRPIQRELPVWLTAIGNPDTFRQAAEIDAHILTCLLTQDLTELASKIKLYRNTLARHHFKPKKVSLFLHTFVGESVVEARTSVLEPFRTYLRGTIELLANYSQHGDVALDVNQFSDEQKEELFDFAFERYLQERSLIGDMEQCQTMLNKVKEADVNEVACIIDFGLSSESVLASLERLNQLREANA